MYVFGTCSLSSLPSDLFRSDRVNRGSSQHPWGTANRWPNRQVTWNRIDLCYVLDRFQPKPLWLFEGSSVGWGVRLTAALSSRAEARSWAAEDQTSGPRADGRWRFRADPRGWDGCWDGVFWSDPQIDRNGFYMVSGDLLFFHLLSM